MRAFLLLLLSLFLFSFSKTSGTGIPPNESKTLGKTLPDVELIDTEGRTFKLSSLRGKPIIINPIYTHCESACPLMTRELKRILPLVGSPGEDFYLLSLTFDPRDEVRDIKDFKERYNLASRGWLVVKVKDKEQLFKLLDAIDFRFATLPGRDFVHPNILLFVSGELKIVKYIYGVNYDPLELRIALSLARGEESLLASLKPYLFFIGFGGITFTSIILIFLLSRRREKVQQTGL